IVLSIEDKLNYLEQPIPPAPVAHADQHVAPEIIAAHNAWIKGSKEIAGLMLMTMEPEIQRNLEPIHAHEMLWELKTLFAQQAEQELLQTTRDFHSCRQEEGYLILIGLRKEYDGFVQNYNMHNMGKTFNELHAMIKLHEQTLPKNNAPSLHAIRAGKVQKGNKHKKWQSQMAARGQNHGKRKNKQAYAPKPKIPRPPKREDPAKDSICHKCGETGHWKRNCPQYLAKLLKKKKNAASGAGGSGIFVIELNTILNRSWIYDTGCGTHICNTTHGLRASRKLKLGALSMYVGNGQREAVDAIGAFYLCLPSGLEIVLNNCHYAPSITRGVISVSRFAIPRDGIFEIDFSNSYTNESSIYAASNKRAKLDLDYALLWHCRLRHISKKHIEKLQHDGLLDLSDLRAFEKCISYMSGKMARKPYTHQVERAKDLLGLIHTYNKHEVFETFKVFQKEVENQLGKTIKLLRSDRGGEYISQVFLDHLKDHGIIAHRTPPYTPQHNGVSKRRNRTLLDMVRSMMSQTNIPNSFWDYALETAVLILNMVPTKKVEKTPYEVRHGQAPKLSYLKVWGCETLVKRDTLTKPDKLEPRYIKCIFIGYPKEMMRYSFYYPPENKVLVARNAEFLENSLINQEASGSIEDHKIIQEEDAHPSIDTSLNHEDDDLEINELQSDIVPIRRSIRTRHAQIVLVELPPNGKTVGSKWLFKKKTDIDGVVHTYKARLGAKGYTQTPGIDYEETFSPVADIRAIRILIAIAACFAMKDLGEAAYILGINIYLDRSRRLIGLCQSAYIEKILKRFCIENSKRRSIPMQEKLKLSKSQGASTPAELKRMQNVLYASAVGSIILDVWVRKFIFGLGVVPTIEEPISMYCDNTRAIAIANESGITKGATHFRAKVHYLREVIEYGDIKVRKSSHR
nr:hypothetical protein [Tanacetum cinerariifolium]